MANFIPSEKNINDFNNGYKFTDGKISLTDINNLIECLLYVQGLAANDPLTTDDDGATRVEIDKQADGTARLHFYNIKGTDGDNGRDGLTPYIDKETLHWCIGEEDTGILAGYKGEERYLHQVAIAFGADAFLENLTIVEDDEYIQVKATSVRTSNICVEYSFIDNNKYIDENGSDTLTILKILKNDAYEELPILGAFHINWNDDGQIKDYFGNIYAVSTTDAGSYAITIYCTFDDVDNIPLFTKPKTAYATVNLSTDGTQIYGNGVSSYITILRHKETSLISGS